MRGRIDGVIEGVLRGWAWDPARPGHRLVVNLLADGEVVAPITAALPRADLEQASLGDGRHGLEFALPLALQDGAPHELALESWWFGKLVRLDTATLLVPRRLHMLRGRIEGIARGQLRGWAWDQSRPTTAVALELWHEGRVVARGIADRHRPELAHGGIGGGAHGFEIGLAGVAPAGAELELRSDPGFGDGSLGRITIPDTMEDAGPPPAPHFLAEARQAEARQDPAGAARILEHGLRLHPADFDLLVIRARVFHALQQWEGAEEAARRAMALRPGHAAPTMLLARIAGSLERHAEAAEHWAAITPQDSAWRERLSRRPRHLAALGRRAEALAELALGARHRPEDPALAKAMAEAAEALGAAGAARTHLRRLLELSPGDRGATARLGSLDHRPAADEPEPLASPLVNPSLRNWLGPVAGVVEGEAQVAAGLVLRGEGLRFAADVPRERRPGELPAYGLRLETERNAEAEFALESRPADLRMGLALEGPAGLAVTLLLRAEGGPDRLLLEARADARARLLRFDLPREHGDALVLRLEGPGTLVMQAPRPLSRLDQKPAASEGFETPDLARRLASPARPVPRDDALVELGLPFTTIEIAPTAPAGTLRAVLDATSAPFECVLAEAAIADPRIRLLLAGATPAEGWVARVEAPPSGGAGWLSALHRAAAATGRASAPGVTLEWRAP